MILVVKKKRLLLMQKNESFFLYLDSCLILKQNLLRSNNKFLINFIYTYFYVLKIMVRIGLICPVTKLFGYTCK